MLYRAEAQSIQNRSWKAGSHQPAAWALAFDLLQTSDDGSIARDKDFPGGENRVEEAEKRDIGENA